jgi:hypothetical protein
VRPRPSAGLRHARARVPVIRRKGAPPGERSRGGGLLCSRPSATDALLRARIGVGDRVYENCRGLADRRTAVPPAPARCGICTGISSEVGRISFRKMRASSPYASFREIDAHLNDNWDPVAVCRSKHSAEALDVLRVMVVKDRVLDGLAVSTLVTLAPEDRPRWRSARGPLREHS